MGALRAKIPTQEGGAPGEGERPVVASGPTTRALERGLAILDCYDIDHWGWTLADICRKTGIPKPTVFRLIKTLERSQYLTLDPVSKKYCLGPSMIRASCVVDSHSELVRLTHPQLEALAAATGETAVLMARVGERGVITLDFVLTSRPFRPHIYVGQILSDLGNAHLQTFLAFLPTEERAAMIARLRASASHSGTDVPFSLEESLKEVRIRRVAFDLGYVTEGLCAAAAPIFGANGQVRATIGVIVQSERFLADGMDWDTPLRDAGNALSASFGYAQAGDEAGGC